MDGGFLVLSPNFVKELGDADSVLFYKVISWLMDDMPLLLGTGYVAPRLLES